MTSDVKIQKSSQDFWKNFKKNRMALLGLIFILLLIFAALLAPVITKYPPAAQDLLNRFNVPSIEHPFGTDNFGRDIFSNVIYGGRVSLYIAFTATILSAFVGTLLGATAGYFGGVVDNIIMRVIDIILSIPSLVLAIAIASVLGNGVRNLILAVSLSGISSYGRIVRASVLSIKNEEYIEAARLSGASPMRIIFRHILPNAIGPLIVQATLGVGTSIIVASSLSFIGLGIQPPTPEWGSMLAAGRPYIRDAAHLTFFPGLAIALTVLSFNLLGDGLRDALDPKRRR